MCLEGVARFSFPCQSRGYDRFRSAIQLIEFLLCEKKYALVLIKDFTLFAQEAEVKVQRRKFFALEAEGVNNFWFSVY